MDKIERMPRRSLAAKIGTIGCVLLVLALSAIGITLWVTWQLEGGAAAVNEAGRMRMQTWRLAQALSTSERQRLESLCEQFDRSLALLRQGDPARPLAVPRDPDSRAALDAIEQRWLDLRRDWVEASALGAAGRLDKGTAQAEDFVATIDRFVDTIEGQLERWTTLLNTAQFVMMVLAVAAALALMYAAQLLVFNPLTRLRDGLERLEMGDLSARVDAAGGDEFAAVAAGFNRMVERLQDLYGTLERRVQDKTEHLETERARLASLYEAAALVARAGTLEALAQGFAAQTRRVARADAVAVRWSDEQNRRYVLLAAEGLPPDLVEAEHCVATGDCFCGQPQQDASTREFPLLDLSAARTAGMQADTGRCKRAGFVSVLSVPVRLHERMVGEIDLFYRVPSTLDDDDRALVDALASHLAGGIEGLRADALRREAAVAEERGLLARELHDSIAQGLAFMKIQASLLRDDMARGDAERVLHTLSELDMGIHESLSDVRELLLHFRTRTNVEDIVPALRATLTKFEHQTGLEARLHIEGEGLPLAPDVQVQVLHVVQGALSNVRKHAGACHVWVDVQQSPSWIVEVRDDGRGMPSVPPADNATNVGLRIMRERADSIGARLDIASAAGAGTRVTLTLPASARTSGPSSLNP